MTEIASIDIVDRIDRLPEVSLNSDWERDPFGHSTEIGKRLVSIGQKFETTFRHTVWFNQPSKVTGEAKKYVLVISLTAKKSVRMEGDDLHLVKHGKKDFTDLQKSELGQILKGS